MLTREDVIAVASRLFAVFLFVLVLRALAQSVDIILGREWAMVWLLLGLSLHAVALVVAALLWFFPLSVARKLLPVARDAGSVPLGQTPDLQALAFSVLGGWVLASALSDALYWLVYFTYPTAVAGDVPVSPEQIAGVVATIGELLIGIFLLFGSHGLVGLLRRFRHAGA